MTRLLKRAREEQGFTLIELMVVILIIGILVAIALPTFLGARSRAQNRAAQADLRNALVAAKTEYTDANSYAQADATATGLLTIEPSLCYVAAATASVSSGAVAGAGCTSAGGASVSVAPNGTVSWAAARLSASGTCYMIKDTAAAGTTFGSNATCTGTQALVSATLTAFP